MNILSLSGQHLFVSEIKRSDKHITLIRMPSIAAQQEDVVPFLFLLLKSTSSTETISMIMRQYKETCTQKQGASISRHMPVWSTKVPAKMLKISTRIATKKKHAIGPNINDIMRYCEPSKNAARSICCLITCNLVGVAAFGMRAVVSPKSLSPSSLAVESKLAAFLISRLVSGAEMLRVVPSAKVTLFFAGSVGVTLPSSCFCGITFGLFPEFTIDESSNDTLIAATELVLSIGPALIDDTPSEAALVLVRLVRLTLIEKSGSVRSGSSAVEICASSDKVASFSGPLSLEDSRDETNGREDRIVDTPSDRVFMRRRLCFRSFLSSDDDCDDPECLPFTTPSRRRIFDKPFTAVSSNDILLIVGAALIDATPAEADLVLGRLFGLTF
mmetsp:Transcript_22362/g.42212  ORF Transcript_22362/g.42212 Transcript_22362/m.42212 type:complete len:386 (-) Transcript_22362:2457-3614(-)